MRCGQALSLLLSLGLGPTLGAQAEGKKEVHLRTRVVDASGQGIAGVGVIWGPAGSLRTADALRNPIAVSDAEGVISFRAAGPPPDIGYMATPLCGLFAKRGYSTIRVSTNSAIMGIPWGAGPAHYLSGITDKVVMRPAGTLSGMVRGADGRPLRGGRVVAMEPLMAGGLKRFFANGAGRQVCYSAATSNASGRFELPGVHPGGMSLEVTAPGYYRKGLRFVAKDQPVDVTLEPSGFVSGKVLDSEGRPVLATISLRSEGHAAQIGVVSRQLRTEPDGSFRISLAARGRYSLQAIQAAPFHSSRMVSSEILSGPRSDIVLEMEVLPEPPAPIKVTVVESGSKKPLAKARVAV